MNDEQQKRAEEVALFRYGVIADLVHLPPGDKQIAKLIQQKSEQSWSIPYSRKIRIAAETIRHWLKLYRKGGFDRLRPKVRADAGKSRRLPQAVVDRLVCIKDEKSELTIKQVIAEARRADDVPDDLALPPSTVHRVLCQHGLTGRTRRKPAVDRRRFCFERAGQLWMSDVMHGPAVVEDKRRKKKTYLIAFIDDATRVIPFCAFARSENTAAFLPVFKQALLRRGLCERLYVDNGSAYRSKHLQIVCAQLGVTLLHTRPYDAAAKGKIERWFRTVRMQLLPVLGEADLGSLDALNRRLWAWVEGEYHHSPHRGLGGQTPLDRWAQTAHGVRYVPADVDLDDLCLFEAKRKVHNDRTVSLDGRIYEVSAELVGQTVTLRYDPQRPPGRPLQVFDSGRRYPDARLVDAYQNCFVRRHRDDHARLVPSAPAPAPKKGLRLSELSGRKNHKSRDDRGDKEGR